MLKVWFENNRIHDRPEAKNSAPRFHATFYLIPSLVYIEVRPMETGVKEARQKPPHPPLLGRSVLRLHRIF